MFYHLGKLATRFRWLIVGMWMVAIAVSLPFAPRASQVLHPGGFVSPDAESERAIDLLAQKLHLNLTVVEVFFTSQNYSADSPQFVEETQQALQLADTKDGRLLVICNRVGQWLTGNLLGPLVINTASRVGEQVTAPRSHPGVVRSSPGTA